MSADRKRVPRDEDEYLGAFHTQLELLNNAANGFDDGSLAEAQNLATRIRVLVYDGPGRGQSFLGQIGVKERLPYLDTAQAEDPPGVIGFGGGLCMISATVGTSEGSPRYSAPLDRLAPERLHPPSAFVDWWGDEVLADDRGNSFSRSAFVLVLRRSVNRRSAAGTSGPAVPVANCEKALPDPAKADRQTD